MTLFTGQTLLQALENIPWDIAVRTYGNCHATYIGMAVQWWLRHDINQNSALESGPTYAYHPRSEKGGGQCDAVFCTDRDAVGILEVEGTRVLYTIEKISKYFQSPVAYFKTLQFAILMVYSYQITGKGDDRTFIAINQPAIIQSLQDISVQHSDKSIIFITIRKAFKRQKNNLRQQSEYYWGQTDEIKGSLFTNGAIITEKVYYTDTIR